jgi:O-Antigen ligase
VRFVSSVTLQPARTSAGLALAGLAVAAGAIAAVQPKIALALAGAGVLLALAFFAPTTHLMLLLFMTLIVGYQLQHRLGSHVLPSDGVLLTGFAAASVKLMSRRLEPRRVAVVCLIAAFAGATVLQVVHGLHAGDNSSQSGDEGRALLGFGALLIATPILDDARGRERIGRGLVILGLFLGFWGLATWSIGFSLGENVDVGLRSSSADFASGHGQLHGGLYGYPVAVIMSATVLLAGHAGRGLKRWSIIGVLVLNLTCLALTYERTFWLMTVVTLGFVIVKMGRGRRLRAAVTIAASGIVALGVIASVSPSTLKKIESRALSLGQYSSDNSVRYRVVETGHVLDKVKAKPILGWGLGNTLYWGQPWERVPPKATWFAHNGYLWVIWKVGAIAALLLFSLLLWAVALRAPPEREPIRRTMRVAAQGGLVVLLLSSVTFPSFNSLTITSVMGLLLAICFMPTVAPRRAGPALSAPRV